jgi:DNA-binding NarL/FixJ family response regulator
VNALSSDEKRFRTIVVDDSPLMVRTICRFLESLDNIEVVGKTTDPIRALEQLAELDADLILVDLQMSGINGLELTRIIRQRFPCVRVIIITVWGMEFRLSTRAAGAHGFVCKCELHAALPAEIQRIFSPKPEAIETLVESNL